MKEIITTNYFWGQDVQMTQFYRVPKSLYSAEYFRKVSFEAKAIYGMMIDRVSLSIKNQWLDEEGKTYIHYSVAQIMEDTGCGKNKILKCLQELEEATGLIERKRVGQGRPDMIYVKNFVLEEVAEVEENMVGTKADSKAKLGGSLQSKPQEVYDANHKEFTNETTRSSDYKPQEVYDANPNNTEINYNNIIYTKSNPIISIKLKNDGMDEMEKYNAYAQLVRENIELDALKERHEFEHEQLQGIYNLILETVISKRSSMVISGQEYPMNLIKSKFLKLNMSHIEYVLDCLKKNTTKVRNIKSYLLAALFNAGSTISSCYQAEVNHDMPQFAG